jgi:hypothetical protein
MLRLSQSACYLERLLLDTKQLILINGGITMAIRIVQLGSPRETDEGLRVGTVRRPPRGVPKSEYARKDFYDRDRICLKGG